MWGKLGLLKVGLFVCFCAGCAINPITGDEDLMFYPEDKDVAIGRKYAPKVEKELAGKIASEELQSYIDRVGQRIARVSHRPDLEYYFVAVEEKSVNAVALPGGHIFVLKGMLEKLTNEAQLAAILGHEIAHVVARDSMAALSRKQALDVLLMGAMFGGAPAEAVRGASVTRLFLDLQYSREDEYEADLVGLAYMAAAGYDPNGAVELVQILEDENEVRRLEFFSTHPSPQNRRAYLAQEVQEKYQNPTALKTGKEDYEVCVLKHLKSKQSRSKSPRPATESAGQPPNK
jgi:predicted Zn-dependent protease